MLSSPWLRKFQVRASVLQTYHIMTKATGGVHLTGELRFRKIALQVEHICMHVCLYECRTYMYARMFFCMNVEHICMHVCFFV